MWHKGLQNRSIEAIVFQDQSHWTIHHIHILLDTSKADPYTLTNSLGNTWVARSCQEMGERVLLRAKTEVQCHRRFVCSDVLPCESQAEAQEWKQALMEQMECAWHVMKYQGRCTGKDHIFYGMFYVYVYITIYCIYMYVCMYVCM